MNDKQIEHAQRIQSTLTPCICGNKQPVIAMSMNLKAFRVNCFGESPECWRGPFQDTIEKAAIIWNSVMNASHTFSIKQDAIPKLKRSENDDGASVY